MSLTVHRFMTLTIVLVMAAALTLSGYLPARAQDEGAYQIDAHAVLMDASGRQVGTIRFLNEAAYGTLAVMVQVNNMTPGFHAFYVSSAGECDVNADPPFSTAGDPLNLQNQEFPFRSSDMPPILVMENGTGAMTFRTDRFTIDDLLDGDGSAVVVEAGARDFGIAGEAAPMAPEGEVEGEQEAQDVTPAPVEGAAEGEAEGEQQAQDVTPTPVEGAAEGEQVTPTPAADEQPAAAGEFVACGVLIEGDLQPTTAEPTGETEGEDVGDEVEEEVEEATEEAEEAVEEGAEEAEEAVEGAAAADEGSVQVILTEYEIDMPTTVRAGTVTFEITNNGSEEHNFEIEGEGDFEEALEENLQAGESATLTVELEPGTYTVYCPVGDHEDMGMQLTLTVTEAEG